jgi:hypothetical protein
VVSAVRRPPRASSPAALKVGLTIGQQPTEPILQRVGARPLAPGQLQFGRPPGRLPPWRSSAVRQAPEAVGQRRSRQAALCLIWNKISYRSPRALSHPAAEAGSGEAY